MTLRSVTHDFRGIDPEEWVDALIEAKPKVGDDSLVKLLEQLNAAEVSILAEGFVSARIRRSDFAEIEPYGVVNSKVRSKIPF